MTCLFHFLQRLLLQTFESQHVPTYSFWRESFNNRLNFYEASPFFLQGVAWPLWRWMPSNAFRCTRPPGTRTGTCAVGLSARIRSRWAQPVGFSKKMGWVGLFAKRLDWFLCDLLSLVCFLSVFVVVRVSSEELEINRSHFFKFLLTPRTNIQFKPSNIGLAAHFAKPFLLWIHLKTVMLRQCARQDVEGQVAVHGICTRQWLQNRSEAEHLAFLDMILPLHSAAAQTLGPLMNEDFDPRKQMWISDWRCERIFHDISKHLDSGRFKTTCLPLTLLFSNKKWEHIS